MSELQIAKYKQLLINELILSFHLLEHEAIKAMENSVIAKMLKTNPEFIMHYSIDDNAEEIFREYKGLPIEV